MKIYETSESFEKMLQSEADMKHIPLGAALELLLLCNMDCKMCDVRLNKDEMKNQGRMLTCDEWLSIVRSACDKGLLFLLLTGGEPLLYPEFKRLYSGISQMGVILEVNTNGTLINEEWADFFCEKGIRQLNITIYGNDDTTYERLCNNPRGFTQVMQAAKLLKERYVPFRFNCTLTPYNIDQLPDFFKIANSFGVDLFPTTYLFPGIRRGKTAQEQFRLTAEEAAVAQVYSTKYASGGKAEDILAKLNQLPRLKDYEEFPCHAGRCFFWMNWKGDVLPCGSFQTPSISLLEHSFEECWNYIVEECKKLPICHDCVDCDKQNICQVCPAVCYAETGSTASRPDYMCQMTEHKVKELKKTVEDEKHL